MVPMLVPVDVLASECDDGTIVAEMQIPGAYQQLCMSLPSRTIKLKSTGETVTVVQGAAEDQSSGASNNSSVSGRTGVALWNSGLLLSRLLDEIAIKESDFFKDKSVLELGSGVALSAIVASKLGASDVVATDGNEEVLELAQRNLELNKVMHNASSAVLKWGTLDTVDFYDSANLVIGSDLTYNSGSWGVLAETLRDVLKTNGYFVYLTLGHAGFNVSSELGGFLTLVESRGEIELVKEGSDAWPFKSIPSLDQLLISSLSPKEREVVSSTGGFKTVVLRKRRKRK